MNLYLRYFDKEALVFNIDEAIDFLKSIPEIEISDDMEHDIRAYAEGDVYYPKRYKVRPHVYFIVIKTTAETMQDFKDKKAIHSGKPQTMIDKKELISGVVTRLTEERYGWYEGSIDFKRVVLIPTTGKYEYRDTHYEAICKAASGQECYERIVDYLKSRVDSRSQFPSAKGKNFRFTYLGMWK